MQWHVPPSWSVRSHLREYWTLNPRPQCDCQSESLPISVRCNSLRVQLYQSWLYSIVCFGSIPEMKPGQAQLHTSLWQVGSQTTPWDRSKIQYRYNSVDHRESARECRRFPVPNFQR